VTEAVTSHDPSKCWPSPSAPRGFDGAARIETSAATTQMATMLSAIKLFVFIVHGVLVDYGIGSETMTLLFSFGSATSLLASTTAMTNIPEALPESLTRNCRVLLSPAGNSPTATCSSN